MGIPTVETPPKKGKWAQVAKELSEENIITPEIDEILQKGIKEFREGFCIGDIDINKQLK